MDRVKLITDRLIAVLSPESIEVIDEGHKHVGHAGAQSGKGHFELNIVAASFSDQNLVARHRMIYDALAELMDNEIHALSINAYAPEEI